MQNHYPACHASLHKSNKSLIDMYYSESKHVLKGLMICAGVHGCLP